MTAITDRLSTALADRYRIERELGRGGMATVYLAEDLKHDRKVALVLRSVLGGSWYPVDSCGIRPGWRIVSFWPPISRHIVLSARIASHHPSDVAGRLHALEWAAPVLAALGGLSLGALILAFRSRWHASAAGDSSSAR